MALPGKSIALVVSWPPLRVVRFSGRSPATGVEYHTLESVRVKVYNAAKMGADCFKYRNKIGVDLAIEAVRRKKATVNEIQRFGKICRVAL